MSEHSEGDAPPLCNICWFGACEEPFGAPCYGRAAKGGDCQCPCTPTSPAPAEEPWEWHPDGPEALAMLDKIRAEEEGA